MLKIQSRSPHPVLSPLPILSIDIRVDEDILAVLGHALLGQHAVLGQYAVHRKPVPRYE